MVVDAGLTIGLLSSCSEATDGWQQIQVTKIVQAIERAERKRGELLIRGISGTHSFLAQFVIHLVKRTRH